MPEWADTGYWMLDGGTLDFRSIRVLPMFLATKFKTITIKSLIEATL
jgi:hypothetical protein